MAGPRWRRAARSSTSRPRRVRLPALDELAQLRGVPHVGRDGKTGETLVKAALAAMFADRALRVCSWSGTNLLGGGDGAALARPGSATSKLRSKALGLEAILGYPVEGLLHIDHVEDLEEWKTAWDHVTFEGFLGTRMSLQFTWQGCDPALAAPLGALDALAFFFKDPVGTGEHRLDRQFARLCAWAARLEEGGPDARLPAPGTAR